MKKEKRILTLQSKIERRDDNGQRHLIGVIPYDSQSERMYFGYETIRRGAFTRTIAEQDVKALWDHDTSKLLGRVKNSTLKFVDTDAGLQCDVTLPDTTIANDAWELVSRDDVSTMSFGFVIIRSNQSETADGDPLQELLEVQLLEVSFGVVFPAYAETDTFALVRSIEAAARKINREQIDAETNDLLRKTIGQLLAVIGNDTEKQDDHPADDAGAGLPASDPLPDYDLMALEIDL